MDLDTILDVYTGLLDHAEDVRAEAMVTLWEIARKQPVPVSVTPIKMMAQFVHTFTVASRMATETVMLLCEIGTQEADDELVAILECGRGNNSQFQDWVRAIHNTKKDDILRRVRIERLSHNRARTIRQALGMLSA